MPKNIMIPHEFLGQIKVQKNQVGTKYVPRFNSAGSFNTLSVKM